MGEEAGRGEIDIRNGMFPSISTPSEEKWNQWWTEDPSHRRCSWERRRVPRSNSGRSCSWHLAKINHHDPCHSHLALSLSLSLPISLLRSELFRLDEIKARPVRG